MGSQSWTQLSDSAQHTAQQHKFYSLNYYNFLAHVLNILASLFLHHQSPGVKKSTLVKPYIFFTPVPVAGEHHTTGLNHFTLNSGSKTYKVTFNDVQQTYCTSLLCIFTSPWCMISVLKFLSPQIVPSLLSILSHQTSQLMSSFNN